VITGLVTPILLQPWRTRVRRRRQIDVKQDRQLPDLSDSRPIDGGTCCVAACHSPRVRQVWPEIEFAIGQRAHIVSVFNRITLADNKNNTQFSC